MQIDEAYLIEIQINRRWELFFPLLTSHGLEKYGKNYKI